MGRPRLAKHPKPAPVIEEEDISQEPVEEEPPHEEEFTAEDAPVKQNQAELVRKAVAAGHEKPSTGVTYIKEEFGVSVDPKYYSVAKSQLKKREGKNGKSPKAATPKASKPSLSSAIPVGFFTDLETLKEMKARYGADFEKLYDLV